MKRIKSVLVLGLLSLFLGVTTVTSYAQSNSTTVRAGITFTTDSTTDTSTQPDSNIGSGESISNNTEGRLPQTGEQTSASLTIIGILCLGLFFYLIRKSTIKKD